MSESRKTISELAGRIRSGETSARAVVESSVNAADRLNETLNAFLQIDRAFAAQRADEVDKHLNKTDLSLAGIPLAIKDNICVKGLQASCGSRIIGSYKPPYNATGLVTFHTKPRLPVAPLASTVLPVFTLFTKIES